MRWEPAVESEAEIARKKGKAKRERKFWGGYILLMACLFIALLIVGALEGCAKKGGDASATTAAEESATSPGASTDAGSAVSISGRVESAGDELDAMKQRGGELLGSLLGSNDTYESIYDEYAGKLNDMTPGKIDEFNSEADASDGSVDSLAEICNNKVSDLAETCNEGVEKMASLMYRQADDYSVYEDWSTKLMDVYMSCAGQVQDAYMARAS